MKKIYGIIILAAILLVSGVGYNVLQANEKDAKQEVDAKKQDNNTHTLLGGKLQYVLKNNDGILTIELKNVSNEVIDLNYTSSQAYDFSLLKDGEVVYNWSANAGFLTVITEKTLKANESEEYVINTKELPVDVGTYTLQFYSVAQELANEAKFETEIDIKVSRQDPILN